jgi:bacteriorhodopsin
MIATGFVATISPRPINYVWYLVSCGFYMGVILLLLGNYRIEAEQNNPGKIGKNSFNRLLTVHIVLWTAYPIVWILAGTGFGILTKDVEGMFYTLLDITSKVGFGLLSINTLKQLEKRPDQSDYKMNHQETSRRVGTKVRDAKERGGSSFSSISNCSS